MHDAEQQPAAIVRSAVISDDELYRYQLSRRWGRESHHILWVMLNPSTADGTVDDQTIRRCIGFSRRWGFDALKVVNLYALRCTRPIHLEHHPDPVGPENFEWIIRSLLDADQVVLAWGAHKTPRTAHPDHAVEIEATLYGRGIPVVALGLTKVGEPRHPLYVRADAEPLLLEGAPA